LTKEKLNIIIPMAGYGSRLRPQTWSKPKPLVSTAGKPVLAHVLDIAAQISDLDNSEISFIIGYQGEMVKPFMQSYFPSIKAHYFTQEELRGQSHAIYMAKEYLSGPTMILFVDTIIDSNISIPSADEADGVVWVKEVEDPRRFGVVSVDDKKNIDKIIEKPDNFDNRLAIIGYYYFAKGEDLRAAIETQINSHETKNGEHFIADAISIMIEGGNRIKAQPVGVWMDAGTPEAVFETNRYLLDKAYDNHGELNLDDSVVVNPPVNIHPFAKITNSMVGPYVSIAAGCVIKDSRLDNSILEKSASLIGSELTNSVLGCRALVSGFKGQLNIGDDSKVEN
jgi:glucose-1-phosphate thymidylyltransferase